MAGKQSQRFKDDWEKSTTPEDCSTEVQERGRDLLDDIVRTMQIFSELEDYVSKKGLEGPGTEGEFGKVTVLIGVADQI